MTPSARISAAIDILADIHTRRRPASDALKEWGLAHRFAGSKDRAAIASLTYDGLRRQASASFLMGAETPRAIMLGALALMRGLDVGAISELFSGERFAPEPLSDDEREKLSARELYAAPEHIQADAPEWLWPRLAASLGPNAIAEVAALGGRAPVDIRINSLKTLRDKLRPDVAHLNPVDTQWSPLGLRFEAGEGGRGPSLQALPEFIKGDFEIQDEGSQLVALMCGAEQGEQVVDLCAGGGGKTLSLAAMMNNTGQIFATDSDLHRLAPIHGRLARAGARNVQVMSPRGHYDEPLRGLVGKIDLVLVDAPCTGTGVWRRNPDAKWRIRPGALEERIKDQDAVLARAATLVKPGGRIAYITCSILSDENEERVAAFLAANPAFSVIDPEQVIALAPDALSERTDLIGPLGLGIQLTPLRTQTDGFFLAIMKKA
jgi:16S rRNA (cytosine967-C5)-methyltransferase